MDILIMYTTCMIIIATYIIEMLTIISKHGKVILNTDLVRLRRIFLNENSYFSLMCCAP